MTALPAEPDGGPDLPAEAVIAAVDLGSNSLHMVVARDRHGQLEIIDRLREMVRLASGLTEAGFLDGGSQDRALACLRRFGQRLRDMQAHQVRVVGTNTLRKAHNAEAFLDAAESALGHPVEVISGIEEARLIYQGVSHHVESAAGQDLVVDIGGGSTELIIGQGYEPLKLESLWLGCVGLSREHFDGGRLSAKRFAKARLAASLELRPIVASFRRAGWARAIGSSGTIRAAGRVIQQLGLGSGTVTVPALEAVIEAIAAAKNIDALSLSGLSADRAPVFPGGIAILTEVMQQFGIEELMVSDGALREGLLYDMLGRMHHHDARERTIRAIQTKFHTDEEQAQRVDTTAGSLLAAVSGSWSLEDDRHRQVLHWAARLHEVGLDIAHSKYHQHGAYLLANADMPGFTWFDQRLLAALVGNHRRKIEMADFDNLPDDWREAAFRLTVLLRLAALLNRARSSESLPVFRLEGRTRGLQIAIDKGWFAANPLTRADLQQEQVFLGAAGFELDVAAAKISAEPARA